MKDVLETEFTSILQFLADKKYISLEAEDRWTCTAGRMLYFSRESKENLESGYVIQKRHYRSESCEGCPLKERCTKAEGNRDVVVSLERLRYQKQDRKILRRKEGLRIGRASDDRTGKPVWTTEKQPGIPAISASRHGESDA